MATTTNYSWATPDDTDLVKDGAAAIRTLGSSIDTTVFTNAGAAVAKSLVDAKGDIIAATADNTVARLAVGANNTVLTADSSTATGLKWATPASGGMTVIDSGTVTSGTLNVGSIPATYNHLQLWIYEFDPGAARGTPAFRFNSDNTSKYQKAQSGAANEAGQTYFHMSYPMNLSVATGLVVLNIFQYANAGANKMFQSYQAGSSDADVDNGTIDSLIGLYRGTGAITSIQTPFDNEGGTSMNFKWILYGVK